MMTRLRKILSRPKSLIEYNYNKMEHSPLNNIIVVLDNPKHIVNVAGVVRVMMNMGISQLRLVNPANYDVHRIDGIAHRSKQLAETAQIYSTLAEALADTTFVVGTTARPRTAQRNYTKPRDIAPIIIEKATKGSVALVFGKEDRGLTNDGLDLCHQLAIIPTTTQHPSLNLAQACLILCYEIQLAFKEAAPYPTGKRNAGPAKHEDIEEMHFALKQGLHQIGFFKGDRHPESVLRMLRTLLSRAEPDLREARLMRAIGFEMSKYFKRSND
jgi:TrmH family RNA methyltransferase